MTDVERVLREQLAEHGDGATAILVAQKQSGLPRATVEKVLHALLAGKQGVPQPPIRFQGRLRAAPAPRLQCPTCGGMFTQLPRHARRHHPVAPDSRPGPPPATALP